MNLKLLLLLLSAAVSIGSSACFYGSDMCGNDAYEEFPSPNGKLKAVLFERDCGATTPFSTQVSIIENNQKLENAPGNAFIGSDDGRAPLTNHQTMERLEIKWVDDEHMVIRYDARGSTQETNPKIVRNVQVQYEQIP